MFRIKLIIGGALFLASCMSMPPDKVNETLPTLTKSKFISQSQAEEAMKSNKCKYLVKGRNYVAPVSITLQNDLKKGAKGIDQWVKLDGGNAYVLVSYKWLSVGNDGSTQLHVDFDTMLCE